MIIFDCERMKYPNTGIYYYCLNLGLQLRKKLGQNIFYYVPKNEQFHFNTSSIIKQNTFHKFLMPKIKNYNLWHTTFQHSDYIPKFNRTIKNVLTIHDLNFLYKKNITDIKKEKYIKNLQSRINRADAIVCISDYVKNDVLNYCNVNKENIVKIYNGTNPLANPMLLTQSFRPSNPFIFSIGTMEEKKNFHVILPLLKDNPNLDFIIAGAMKDLSYLKKIESLFYENELLNNFKYLGQISEQEKAWYYNHCKAFVLTSLSEGFGLPIIEAMSVGKPVFLSRNTALPEIGGGEAYYFDNFDAETMIQIFKNGINHFNKNIELNTTNNIQRAKQFSWEKAANEYISLYNQLT